MGNEVVNRRLNIYIDSEAAQKQLDALTKKEIELTASIEKSQKAGKDFSKEMAQLGRTKDQIGQIKDVLDGKVLPSVKQAEAAVKRLRNELRQMPADSKAAADKFQEFKKAEATLNLVKKQFTEVRNETKGFGGVMDTAFGMFLGGGLLQAVNGVAGRMKQFLSDSIGEALQAEENASRLKATLDNIGRGDAFAGLSKAAVDMAKQFKFLDNDDVIAVFEKLITYGKLTEDQIKQLTPVIVDFASKQRISLEEATGVVIKAIGGSGKALKEYGVDVKDAKTVTEGFGIIMDQLKPRVEGAAKTFGETTAGQIAITRQEIKNLQEDIGTELLPALRGVLKFTSSALQGIDSMFSSIAKGFRGLGGGGVDRKGALADQSSFQNDILSSFGGLSESDQDAQINASRQRIRNLGKAIREAYNEEQKKTFTALYNQEGEFQLKIKAIRNGETGAPGSAVLGTGDNSAAEELAKQKAKEAADKAKEAADNARRAAEELARLKSDWDKFSSQLEIDGTKINAPILSAFIELDNKVKEQTDKIASFLKKGIITPAQAKEAMDFVEQIYTAQAEAIRKQFETVRVPIQLAPPDQAEIDKDAEGFVKKIQNSITKMWEPPKETKGGTGVGWLDSKDDNGVTVEERIKQFSTFASDAATTIMNVRMEADQRAFDAEMRNYERRKDADRKLLNSKVINQREYDRRIAAIERQQAARELQFRQKQFQQEKQQKTASALLALPMVILSTLDKFGPPVPPNVLGIAAMAFTVATSALQIAAIQSAKPPQFATGGFVPNGPSHAAGGISLVDNRSGRTVGEVEGGEPILSRATYAKNRGLVDALLYASQNNGGAFNPSWSNASPRGMNIGRISSSMQRVRFADGGIIPTVPGDDNGNTQMQAMLTALLNRLDQPAKAYVVYGDYEAQADRINAIRKNGMIA